MKAPLLQVEGLTVAFAGAGAGVHEVIRDVGFELGAGRSLALVGPSGCGKSLTARAICGLLPPSAHWSGTIRWDGRPLRDPSSAEWHAVRGAGVALVLQEPTTSLNPVIAVGEQIAETVRHHRRCSAEEARRRMLDLLQEVRFADPAVQARRLPHELSGGMRQRALLAAALACRPRLLIADEPTTALDPTVQREILVLLQDIRRRHDMALLFITHDAELVPLLAERQATMAEGRLVDIADVETVAPPRPVSSARTVPIPTEPVLTAQGVSVGYPRTGRLGGSAMTTKDLVVHEVDLTLARGCAVGLAGETGCGKTTLARALTLHLPVHRGEIRLDGQVISGLTGIARRRCRRRIQLVFQDPAASLNPRLSVGDVLAEAAGPAGRERVAPLLEEVGLAADLAERLPSQLSGGQRQRVAVARALAVDPGVLVADEPTSALDAEQRTRLLDLLDDLMIRRGLALLLISHDLERLQRRCAQVVIMLAGHVVEAYRPGSGPGPRHPYTRSLLAAAPSRLAAAPGDLAGVAAKETGAGRSPFAGCPWRHACPLRKPQCENELPALRQVGEGEFVRCPLTS